MFTFLSEIRLNFDYNLIILANFRVKTQKSMDFACTFSKSSIFWGGDFLKKIIFFPLKIYILQQKML